MISFKRKDLFFLFVYICLYLYCFSFLLYSNKQKAYYELSNELYTNHHTVLINKGDTKWLTAPMSEASYRVFLEYNDTFRFLLQNNGEWSPPMVSGYYSIEDQGGYKAVVGKEMLEYVHKDNDENYIEFQGVNYQVTGVTGASFASPIDYLVILYGANEIPITSDMRIILDSDSKSTVTRITHNILENTPSVTHIQSVQKGLSRTANMSYFYYLLLIEMFLLLVFSMFAFLRYWYEKGKMTIHVLCLLGISKMDINKGLFIKISFNILISSVVASIIFILTNYEYLLILKLMIWVAIFFLFCSYIFLIIFIYNDKFHTRNEMVKNDNK